MVVPGDLEPFTGAMEARRSSVKSLEIEGLIRKYRLHPRIDCSVR